MAAPQYLVVRGPGAYVDGVGFVRAGQFFNAPAGCVPSRYFRAMNKEAQAELAKLKAQLEKQDEERKRYYANGGSPLKDRDGRVIRAPELAPDVNLDLWVQQTEAPVVEESGLSLGDLADLTAGKRAESGAHLDARKTGASKRAADG